MTVACSASAPYCADTTFELISVSFTGRDPELISEARVEASFSVKLPSIIQSPLMVLLTLAAEM